MRVLVADAGARGAALAWKIQQSPNCDPDGLFVAPGNGQQIGQNLDVDIKNVDAVLDAVESHGIDFTVIGPEDPLAAGLADALRERGRLVFGPNANAARLESSKAFARGVARRSGVPSPHHETFTSSAAAYGYVGAQPSNRRWVVKASGLAGGKGAIMCCDRAEALKAIEDLMVHRVHGAAGDTIVIEEWIQGTHELSLFTLSDGETDLPFGVSMDHKRRYDGDQGPNTGGMGAVAPVPMFTSGHHIDYLTQQMARPVLAHMRENSNPFSGCLFAGLMMTSEGPRLLEYNVRFGDPEILPVFAMLEDDQDVLPYLVACANGTLKDLPPLRWRKGYAACVVLVGVNYPTAPSRGALITGIERAEELSDVVVFHGGTKHEGDHVYTNGGRILGVTGRGATLRKAIGRAYEAAALINFEGKDCRSDIGRSLEALWDL